MKSHFSILTKIMLKVLIKQEAECCICLFSTLEQTVLSENAVLVETKIFTHRFHSQVD